MSASIDPNNNGEREGFECSLTPEEAKFLMKIMPKGFCLVKSNQTSKFLPSKKKSVVDSAGDDIYGDKGRRVSRNQNTRIAGSDYNYTFKSLRKSLSDSLKKCKSILDSVKKHKLAYVFLEPVDPVALNIPDYFTIIKNPMDLSTVESHLKSGKYETPFDFGKDMRLIFKNAMDYNPKASNVYSFAVTLLAYFEKKFNDLESNPGNDNYPVVQDASQKYEQKLDKITIPKPTYIKPMTYEEKRNLSQAIHLLSPDALTGVWDIICSHNSNVNKEDELIFDINKLPVEIARKLEKYVGTKLKGHQKQKKAPKPEAVEQKKNYIQPMTPFGGDVTAATFPTSKPMDIVPEREKLEGSRKGSKSDSSFFTDSDEE